MILQVISGKSLDAAREQFQNLLEIFTPADAKSDCSRQGEAELRILKFKTTWSEFHHLPRVSPKQLCAQQVLPSLLKSEHFWLDQAHSFDKEDLGNF